MKNAGILVLLACMIAAGGAVGVSAWMMLEGATASPSIDDIERLRTAPASGEDAQSGLTARQQADSVQRALRADGLIATCMERFKIRLGRYPNALDDLVKRPLDLAIGAKWGGPYIHNEGLLIDPWQQPYHYLSPGQHNPEAYDIWSIGADGADGTFDDLGNW